MELADTICRDFTSYAILSSIALIYVPCVIFGYKSMKDREPFNIKWTVFAWNVVFSVLSLVGFVLYLVTCPECLLTYNFPFTSLSSECKWVALLFVWSKLFEFGDTAWLVLRKRPLIFLHVYHHCLTALYALHSVLVRAPYAHYAIFVNLGVHAVMYAYYAASGVMYRNKFLKSCRPFITVIQLAQMVFGLGFSLLGASYEGFSAEVHRDAVMCLAMYTSYFYLFLHLFISNYTSKNSLHLTYLSTPFLLIMLSVTTMGSAGLDDLLLAPAVLAICVVKCACLAGIFRIMSHATGVDTSSLTFRNMMFPSAANEVFIGSSIFTKSFRYLIMYSVVPAAAIFSCVYLFSIPVGACSMSIGVVWCVAGLKQFYKALFSVNQGALDGTGSVAGSTGTTTGAVNPSISPMHSESHRSSVISDTSEYTSTGASRRCSVSTSEGGRSSVPASLGSAHPSALMGDLKVDENSIQLTRSSIPHNIQGPFADENVDVADDVSVKGTRKSTRSSIVGTGERSSIAVTERRSSIVSNRD